MEERIEYEPASLSDKWSFKRGEVANFFFNRSYQWLAKAEAKGFEVPDGVFYEPTWDDSGNRVYHLVDVDALASCLAHNGIISGDKAARVFRIIKEFSELWSSR